MDRHSYTLYVAGGSDLAARALANFERLVRGRLGGRCSLVVIDVLVDSRRARQDRVVATPLLIRDAPAPVVKILGDLSDDERVLDLLGLPTEGEGRSS